MLAVDLCAGAGGKALALASAMPNQGRILGCDTDRSRLSRLSPRAARAGATIIETVLLDPGKEAEALAATKDYADVVLQIGSTSWQERGWQAGVMSVVAVSLKQSKDAK